MNRNTQLYHPVHWPVWLFLGVLRVLVILPLSLLLWLGRQLGHLLYYCAPERRRITQTNLSRAFPELDTKGVNLLVQAHFRSLGMGIFETAFAWWASDQRIQAVSNLVGVEQLAAYQQRGQGVILMGGHFTCLEMMGRILSLKLRFAVTYRQHENPVIELMYQTHRGKCYKNVINRNDVRSMVKWLKKGEILWLAPDQNISSSNYVFSPFFGIPAATTTSMSRLTRLGSAVLIPHLFERTADHGLFKMTIHSALEDFPTGDVQADTDRTMQIIESYARIHPEQYLWSHRRFKHRPLGEPDFYSK